MTLAGWTLPQTPTGRSAVVAPPPWHYSGDIVTVDFTAPPDRVAALLPPGLEPAPDGAASVVFADWCSSSDHDERVLADPGVGQYREAYVVLHARRDGRRVGRVPHIWVDSGLSLLRGQIQGFPKKLGEIAYLLMTPGVTLGYRQRDISIEIDGVPAGTRRLYTAMVGNTENGGGGMKLLPASMVSGAAAGEHHDERSHAEHAHAGDEASDIEWEDGMLEVNRMTTPANMRWKLIDRATGAEGAAIDWRFRVGQRVKIRLVNEMDSDHPMPHPFHVHGAGRFLVLARDGTVEPNLVWKDTVLVHTGETVDILLEVTNPGLWMAHCHIAEHHESGMMFSFRVDP